MKRMLIALAAAPIIALAAPKELLDVQTNFAKQGKEHIAEEEVSLNLAEFEEIESLKKALQKQQEAAKEEKIVVITEMSKNFEDEARKVSTERMQRMAQQAANKKREEDFRKRLLS